MSPSLRSEGAIFLLSGALFVWNLSRSWLYLTDDAFISLRYSIRFAQGLGLTWNDGERVEGYSNLLWVLLLSLPAALGVDPVMAMVGLGLACTTILFWGLLRATRALGPLAQAACLLALAVSGPTGIWTQAGLEGPLFTVLCAGAALLLHLHLHGPGPLLPQPPRPTASTAASPSLPSRFGISPFLGFAAVLLGFACLTRPDGPVVVAGLAAGLFLAGGQDRRAFVQSAVLSIIPAVFTFAQLGFRLAYYDDWLPNTAHAKLDVSSADRVEAGLLYIWPWWKAGAPLWGLVFFGAFFPSRAAPQLTRLILPAILLWNVWIVRAGGDHFPAFRMLVVVEPLRALLVGAALAGLAERVAPTFARFWPARGASAFSTLLLLGCIPVGIQYWRAQEYTPSMGLSRVNDWTPRLEPVGRLLRALFHEEQPLLATCAAGAIPYYSGLPGLDPLGLTDRHIARKKLRPGTIGMHGHEAGDTAYVLEKAPDLVLVCAPRGGPDPCLPQEKELLEHPDFAKNYQLSWILAEDPIEEKMGLHVRKSSTKVGFQVSKAGLRIPATLLATDPLHPARRIPATHPVDAAPPRLVVHRPAGAGLILTDLPSLGDPTDFVVELLPPPAGTPETSWNTQLSAQPDGHWQLSISNQIPLELEAILVSPRPATPTETPAITEPLPIPLPGSG